MRTKFTLLSKTEYENTYSLSFTVVTTDTEENKKFFKWTPGGSVDLQVVSKETADQMSVGKSYYVDFTEAAEETDE